MGLRTYDQFLGFFNTFLGVRGSFIQSGYLCDPEVIDAQASAPDEEWLPSAPSLFGWTQQVDALTNIADQLIAGRASGKVEPKFYPRPVVPAEKERKRRKSRKQITGIEAALARGVEADSWNYLS